MSGMDRLLSKSMDAVIRKNLGSTSTQKIEERLFEKYGMSLNQAIEQFHKIDAVLREFFGAGADGLEKKFLDNVCKTNGKSKKGNWYCITDSVISGEILEAFGDEDKKMIINSVADEPKIISDILNTCKIPQTSGYRKTNALIKSGLLIINGYSETPDGRKINKYKALFDNVRINIVKNKIEIDIQLSQEHFEKSSILQVICNA
jgi:hypothetical protein